MSPWAPAPRSLGCREQRGWLNLLLPLTSGRIEQLRRGTPFWEILAQHGVPSAIVKMPDNFPPEVRFGAKGKVRALAGMGTPDLLGTYGTFQVLTDDPELLGRQMRGGVAHRLDFRRGMARASLLGPPDPFSARKEALGLPVEVIADVERRVALVRVGAEERLLRPGEWSGWVPLSFRTRLGTRIPAMVRFFLRSLEPHVTLYVSPANVDPLDPALPIAWPPDETRRLAKAVGRFHTLGMPEDTKALQAGVLSHEQFLEQALLVLGESERLLFHELGRHHEGLLFFYFSTIDQASHVFLRAMDPEAPATLARHAAVLPGLYARLDAIVGRVLDAVGPETAVVVMSDHGFSSFTRKFNLNTWLAERGYLAVRAEGDSRGDSLGHIDWPRTQAYGLGLNALYVNLRGREREGTVEPGDREALLERLERELLEQRDPETGARVVASVTRPPVGPHADRAPDLVVGYARGYRVSDESAMGTVSDRLIQPNEETWSADHCVARDLVPGVLLVNRRLVATRAGLEDVAPTLLGLFGLPRPAGMAGRNLVQPEQGEKR